MRSISNADTADPLTEVSDDASNEDSAVVGAPARPTGLKAVVGNARFRLELDDPG